MSVFFIIKYTIVFTIQKLDYNKRYIYPKVDCVRLRLEFEYTIYRSNCTILKIKYSVVTAPQRVLYIYSLYNSTRLIKPNP